jgi:hypothetical protein
MPATGGRNALVAGSLGAFCVGVWAYTMLAVRGGRDEVDAAIAKREKPAAN